MRFEMVIKAEMEGTEEEVMVLITRGVKQYSNRRKTMGRPCLSDFHIETIETWKQSVEILRDDKRRKKIPE